jgi:hypothetical protein
MSGLSIIPAERSWQCYRLLVKKNIDESQNDKIDFRFGSADPQTLKMNKGMRVKNIGKISFFWGLLNAARILERRFIPFPLSLAGYLFQPFFGLHIKNTQVDGLNIKSLKVFNNDFNELWQNGVGDKGISIIKNSAYLNWRYSECPGYKYERMAAYRGNTLEGFIVFCKIANSCGSFILELSARDGKREIILALLGQLFKNLSEKRIGHIRAAFPRQSAEARILEELGFKYWGFSMWTPRIMLAANVIDRPSPRFDLNAWRFSLGDWVVH